MRRMSLYLISLLLIGLSIDVSAQWAVNKNAREDARYVRFLQGSEDITIDGVEESVWAKADSIVVGYGQTKYLPGSGYDKWTGLSVPGDSANAVFKFLYKAPWIYFLFKAQDKSVGGWDWGQFDGIIMAFKEKPANHKWVQAWDYRLEHFLTYGYKWANPNTTTPPIGAQPLLKGHTSVDGGGDTSRTRWTQFTTVLGGQSNDTLPDLGWVSEHRFRVDSLGFNTNGDIMPFSFSIFDGDGFLDSNQTNNAHTRTWWGCPWNENWYYAALFLDPSITTSTTGSPIPPVDYTIPRLRSGDAITVDGNLAEWKTDNTLHFRAKYNDDAGFNTIKGTGAWASGYQQLDWNGLQTVVDGPEVDYWLTYDNANFYVGAKVTDQIVTRPSTGGRKDGITFFMTPRVYNNGSGIFPSKTLTVNVDSLGAAQAGEDLVALADTGGVEYDLMLAPGTNIGNITIPDSGYFVELKLPFATFGYPSNLGDSVVFIGALVNDVDIFEDTASNTYAKTWWFIQQPGQHAPTWSVLGPANPPVGVNDEPQIPLSIELFDNYPNPFNPTTNIRYSVNATADVTLSVYNILGQLVSVMKKAGVPAGFDEFKFNASRLSSGVYMYQLTVQNQSSKQVVNTAVKKMILIK